MEIKKEEINLLNLIKELEPSEIDKINVFLNKLNNMDDNSKLEIIKSIISYSLIRIDKPQKRDEQIICEVDGHVFTPWQRNVLEKYDNKNEEVIYWRRKCTRCNLVDVSSIDPKVIEYNKSK